MNYLKHYDLMISKARDRQRPKEYCENHHIIPKHRGGTDAEINMAILTGREHFLAHYLLAKIYGGKDWFPVAAFVRGFNAHRKGIKISKILHEKGKKEARKVHSRFMKEYSNRPENVKRSSDAAKAQSEDKEAAQSKREKLINMYKNPEYKESIRQKTIEAMKCPIIREKLSYKARERLACLPGECKVVNARKVKCIETGKIFNSLQLAAAWLREMGNQKAGHASVRSASIGIQKHAYGYHWEYVE